VELLDVTGRRLVADAAGDLWSKSADGATMAGLLVLVVEVGWRRCDGDCWECCSALRLARWGVLFSGAR
jgi:hypothetical protein